MKELNVGIEIIEHLDPQGILCGIYYIVRIVNLEETMINTPDINKFEWIEINDIPFVLLIDKIALIKYREKYKVFEE